MARKTSTPCIYNSPGRSEWLPLFRKQWSLHRWNLVELHTLYNTSYPSSIKILSDRDIWEGTSVKGQTDWFVAAEALFPL